MLSLNVRQFAKETCRFSEIRIVLRRFEQTENFAQTGMFSYKLQ